MKISELETQLSRVVVLSEQLKESARSMCDILAMAPTEDVPPGVTCDFANWISGLADLRNTILSLQDPELWGLGEQQE